MTTQTQTKYVWADGTTHDVPEAMIPESEVKPAFFGPTARRVFGIGVAFAGSMAAVVLAQGAAHTINRKLMGSDTLDPFGNKHLPKGFSHTRDVPAHLHNPPAGA